MVPSSPITSSQSQSTCERDVNSKRRGEERIILYKIITGTLWKEAKIRAGTFCLHLEVPLVYMCEDYCPISQ